MLFALLSSSRRSCRGFRLAEVLEVLLNVLEKIIEFLGSLHEPLLLEFVALILHQLAERNHQSPRIRLVYVKPLYYDPKGLVNCLTS